jgi:hypothetical protein
VTRLQNRIVKPNKQYDGYIRYGNLCVTGEPEDVQQALEDPKWRIAMQEEYDALERNKT